MAAILVVGAVGDSGRGRATLDDVGLACQCGQGWRRELAVRLVPGKAAQHPAAAGCKGVLLLTQGSGHHVGAVLQVTHGHRGLHAVVGGGCVGRRVGLLHEPLVTPARADGLVPADGRLTGVPGADEDAVERAVGCGPGYRGRRCDRGAGAVRPYRSAVGQAVGVDGARPVAHHDRRTAGEIGHVGRRKRDRAAGVGDRLRPQRTPECHGRTFGGRTRRCRHRSGQGRAGPGPEADDDGRHHRAEAPPSRSGTPWSDTATHRPCRCCADHLLPPLAGGVADPRTTVPAAGERQWTFPLRRAAAKVSPDPVRLGWPAGGGDGG